MTVSGSLLISGTLIFSNYIVLHKSVQIEYDTEALLLVDIRSAVSSLELCTVRQDL